MQVSGCGPITIYYDLSITTVIIASVPEGTAYVLNLENKDMVKTIRANEEGETEIIHEFTKNR